MIEPKTELGKKLMEIRKKIPQPLLVEGRKVLFSLLSGSHAYGTATPESDEDLRGVVMPKPEEILGLDRFELLEKKHGEDVVMYSLHMFIRLLVIKGNPNVHEWLWVRDYEHMTPLGKEIIGLRERWLSAKLFKTSCLIIHLSNPSR